MTSYLTSDDQDKKTEIETQFIKSVPAIKHFPINSAICVPSSCSSADLRSIINEVLNYSIVKLTNEQIICDTKESIEFNINNLQYSQIVSL